MLVFYFSSYIGGFFLKYLHEHLSKRTTCKNSILGNALYYYSYVVIFLQELKEKLQDQENASKNLKSEVRYNI